MKNICEKYLRNKSLILGTSFIIGCLIIGLSMLQMIKNFKNLDRTVIVKGLSERDVVSDIAIWRIVSKRVANQSEILYKLNKKDAEYIVSFLTNHHISPDEITVLPPNVTDQFTFSYNNPNSDAYRFSSEQIISVYSTNVLLVRDLSHQIGDLGKYGITFSGYTEYNNPVTYIFTNINSIKPEMVEEANKYARHTAIKFAEDSGSKLGKIKKANQGQLTISDRDKSNEHIKKIRIVSTVEYFLVD